MSTTINNELLTDITGKRIAQALELKNNKIAALSIKTITSNDTYIAANDNVDGYSEVTVNVPNSYVAEDEGKVVSNNTLITQTSTTKTANGTYDTTTNNEVVVNVAPNLQSKTATENGTVTPDQGYDGLSSVVVNVSGSMSPLVIQPLKYLTNSHYYVGNGQEYYYADPIETVASYELEVGAHYIVTLNGTPGPRFRRVMLDNEPFTVIPQNPPAPGSGQIVVIQQNGTDVDSGYTENPPAYKNFAFEATKRYLGLHLSLNPGDTPTVYLFKII